MSRKNKQYELPSSVVEVVRALCYDYERRTRALRRGEVADEVRERYIFINGAIENALEQLEEGIRDAILSDICDRRGYARSSLSWFTAKNTYYNRRRKFVYCVAKGLLLV